LSLSGLLNVFLQTAAAKGGVSSTEYIIFSE